MAQSAPHQPPERDYPLADVIPIRPVALDEAPAVDGHAHTIECSPLYSTYGARPEWSGRIITDPEEIRAIRKRVEAGAAGRGAWRRRLARIRRGR